MRFVAVLIGAAVGAFLAHQLMMATLTSIDDFEKFYFSTSEARNWLQRFSTYSYWPVAGACLGAGLAWGCITLGNRMMRRTRK